MRTTSRSAGPTAEDAISTEQILDRNTAEAAGYLDATTEQLAEVLRPLLVGGHSRQSLNEFEDRCSKLR